MRERILVIIIILICGLMLLADQSTINSATDATALATSNSPIVPTIVVNTTEDTLGSCPERCTLRVAIGIAKEGDIIGFANTLVGKIVLESTITIDKNLTIVGPGANALAIDGNNKVGLLEVSGAKVNLSGLMFQNGNNSFAGVVVNTGGLLIISNSIFAENSSTDRGGAIRNVAGYLDISSSTFYGNKADDGGGAIYSVGGRITLTNSTFVGNQAGATGGALRWCGGTTTLVNNTFTQNIAEAYGGAIYVECPSDSASIFRSNLVAKNLAFQDGPDIYGSLESQGYNLVSNSKGVTGLVDTDQRDIDAQLGTLDDNGGSTLTIALKPGSPAIGKGGSNCPKTDERGNARKKPCDIGAYESDS